MKKKIPLIGFLYIHHRYVCIYVWLCIFELINFRFFQNFVSRVLKRSWNYNNGLVYSVEGIYWHCRLLSVIRTRWLYFAFLMAFGSSLFVWGSQWCQSMFFCWRHELIVIFIHIFFFFWFYSSEMFFLRQNQYPSTENISPGLLITL